MTEIELMVEHHRRKFRQLSPNGQYSFQPIFQWANGGLALALRPDIHATINTPYTISLRHTDERIRGSDRFVLTFDDDAEAIMFKLRWM